MCNLISFCAKPFEADMTLAFLLGAMHLFKMSSCVCFDGELLLAHITPPSLVVAVPTDVFI